MIDLTRTPLLLSEAYTKGPTEYGEWDKHMTTHDGHEIHTRVDRESGERQWNVSTNLPRGKSINTTTRLPSDYNKSQRQIQHTVGTKDKQLHHTVSQQGSDKPYTVKDALSAHRSYASKHTRKQQRLVTKPKLPQ